jgi:hypothetical protein
MPGWFLGYEPSEISPASDQTDPPTRYKTAKRLARLVVLSRLTKGIA